MITIETLVREVLEAARIPDGCKRRDVSDELREHLKDLAAQAVENGYFGERAEQFVLENFGSPHEVGRAFARVYRFERFRFYVTAATVLGTILTALATLFVYAAQSWLVWKLGFNLTLSARHFSREFILIASAVSGYVAIYFAKRQALPGRWGKMAIGGGILVLCVGVVWISPDVGRTTGFGLLYAVLIHGVESYCRGRVARIGISVLAVGAAGLAFATLALGNPSRSTSFMVLTWLVIGLAINTAASTANTLGSRILARRFAE